MLPEMFSFISRGTDSAISGTTVGSGDLSPADPNLSAGLLPRLDCSETTAALAAAGIECPPADGRLLSTGAARLIDIGLIDRIDQSSQTHPTSRTHAPIRTSTIP